MARPEIAFTKELIDMGFLPRALGAEACQRLANAFARKGENAVKKWLRIRAKRGPISSIRLFDMILADVKEETVADDDSRPEPTPIDELEAEETDYQENLKLVQDLGTGFTKPDYWDGKELPTYLYVKGNSISEEEFVRKVREYTTHPYILVREESAKLGISMHEWCRRNGLKYEGLII